MGDSGYPKEIANGFEGIPSNIDAVFVWSGNGKIYFFKGSQYWRFDPGQKPPIKSSYPKSISNWDGIPDYIDDVIHYSNGFTYFFKGLLLQIQRRHVQCVKISPAILSQANGLLVVWVSLDPESRYLIRQGCTKKSCAK